MSGLVDQPLYWSIYWACLPLVGEKSASQTNRTQLTCFGAQSFWNKELLNYCTMSIKGIATGDAHVGSGHGRLESITRVTCSSAPQLRCTKGVCVISTSLFAEECLHSSGDSIVLMLQNRKVLVR